MQFSCGEEGAGENLFIVDHLDIPNPNRFGEVVTDGGPINILNTERYGSYSHLDVMVLQRFNFKKINLTTYLDLQNIIDCNNQWERVYLGGGTYEMSYQYKRLPVGEIIIEF